MPTFSPNSLDTSFMGEFMSTAVWQTFHSAKLFMSYNFSSGN